MSCISHTINHMMDNRPTQQDILDSLYKTEVLPDMLKSLSIPDTEENLSKVLLSIRFSELDATVFYGDDILGYLFGSYKDGVISFEFHPLEE